VELVVSLVAPRRLQIKIAPENLEALYELSPLQQGMLYHSRYTAEPEVYLLQLGCTLHGALDLAAFERAWQQGTGASPCRSRSRTGARRRPRKR
jgi:hypothetical protein